MALSRETLERSLLRKGNNYRLKSFFKRAEAGEALTVAFLGGSITQGAVASTEKLCYAYLTFEWFVKTFPKAKFTYVNAGIGGTTSQYGVSRADRDILSKDPDLVFIEFSVNDTTDELFKETYEGLVRKVWNYKTAPAVAVLHNARYDNGETAQEIHAAIGDAYALPAASILNGEYVDIEKGLIDRNSVTSDFLHPNDLGHRMLSEQLSFLLETIYRDEKVDAPFELPAPLTKNRFEHAGRIMGADGAKLQGFVKDETERQASWDHFHYGWTAVKEGDKICFEIEACIIALMYRKTPKRPAQKALAVLDGDASKPIVLDANFDEDWGDCLYCETILTSDVKKKHTLEITLTEAHEDDAMPFYLLPVLYA